MSKRAKNTGDVEQRVVWPAGAVYPDGHVIVKPGDTIPDEVPQDVVDELLARPGWSEAKSENKPAAKADDTEGKA